MNKTELNVLNKRLAELLGYRIATTFDFKPKAGDVYVAGRCTPDYIGTVYRSASQPGYFYNFTPTTDMAQAMELGIEHKLQIDFEDNMVLILVNNEWEAVEGSTPMEAIVRAVIKMLESERS